MERRECPLDAWLASKFEPPHLPVTDDELKAKIEDCDRRLYGWTPPGRSLR